MQINWLLPSPSTIPVLKPYPQTVDLDQNRFGTDPAEPNSKRTTSVIKSWRNGTETD